MVFKIKMFNFKIYKKKPGNKFLVLGKIDKKNKNKNLKNKNLKKKMKKLR